MYERMLAREPPEFSSKEVGLQIERHRARMALWVFRALNTCGDRQDRAWLDDDRFSGRSDLGPPGDDVDDLQRFGLDVLARRSRVLPPKRSVGYPPPRTRWTQATPSWPDNSVSKEPRGSGRSQHSEAEEADSSLALGTCCVSGCEGGSDHGPADLGARECSTPSRATRSFPVNQSKGSAVTACLMAAWMARSSSSVAGCPEPDLAWFG